MMQLLMALLLALIPMGTALGQTPDREVRATVQGTVDVRQETQRQEDRWAEEQEELKARYRTAKADVEALERQKASLEKRDAALREQVAELNRRIDEADRLEAGLQSVMEETLERLAAFAGEDLPFLPEERSQRIRNLRETLAQPNTSPGEKLRMLLEALQVEAEYGDTVETYQERIDVGGESLFADIFRLGRLSLFWMTPDGERVGEFDRVTGRWVELPERTRKSIRMAVEMAARQRPVELIRLPIGRIQP